MTINTSQLNLSSQALGSGGVFGYSGNPGTGNLFLAVSPGAGTDQFGNQFGAGLNASGGTLTTMSLIGAIMDQTTLLQGSSIQQGNILQPVITGGTAVSLVQTLVNGQGQVLGYTQGATAVTFATNGVYLWTCPTGITSGRIQCWGAGAGAGGGTTTQGGESGGGGEYAEEPTYQLVPGAVYQIYVGAGGQGGETGNLGYAGGLTSFGPALTTTPGITVLASGGIAGAFPDGGQGGTGSVNTIHFNGGNGAAASGQTGGNGGGSSGGPASQGNPGNQSANSTGASGGAAVAGGGAGGAGGNIDVNGVNGAAPGGGGGGCGAGVTVVQSKTYNPNSSGGSYCYYGADAAPPYAPNAQRNHNGLMYQGVQGYSPPSLQSTGHQFSYFTLPFAQIQSDLSGATVTSVAIQIKSLYSVYGGGVTLYCIMGYSNASSFFAKAPSDTRVAVMSFPTTVGKAITQNVGLRGSIGTALQNGNAKSIIIGPGGSSNNFSYWGYFDSGQTGGYFPAIIVNYYTGTPVVQAGNGGDGQCIISYQSATPGFQLAVSSVAAADVYGYTFQPGFSGPQLNLSAQAAIPAATAATAIITANAMATPTIMLPSGLNGQTRIVQTDHSSIQTGNSSAVTTVTKTWTVPTSDATVGTYYEVTSFGGGGLQNAAALTLGVSLNGAAPICQMTIGPGFLATGSTFNWNYKAMMLVSAAGTSGTAMICTNGALSLQGGTLSSGTNNNNAAIAGPTSTQALNTGTVNTLALTLKWSTTGTNLNAYSNGSVFTREGP